MKYLLVGLLHAWRLLISPLYGNVCRYYPSCSAYALRAVSYHGAVKGSWLTVRRLLSCHPWAAGGYDPVRGTPEFDEEMRERRAAAATMGAVPGRSAPADGCTGHGHREHEEVVAVAHREGGK
ncbi:MAG TPA: membrane protein insertion efficiency factor YidD [Propionibacteriaceae bacterium]|nr:membrane protein insertion efficiency factor YidD [Propionibacteriaceae bacterium]